jgi:biopolymer transport protein ExbD
VLGRPSIQALTDGAMDRQALLSRISIDPNVCFGKPGIAILRLPEPMSVQNLHDAAPDRPVVVQGDRRLRYGEVRLILELIQQAGFENVGLIAEREG